MNTKTTEQINAEIEALYTRCIDLRTAMNSLTNEVMMFRKNNLLGTPQSRKVITEFMRRNERLQREMDEAEVQAALLQLAVRADEIHLARSTTTLQ